VQIKLKIVNYLKYDRYHEKGGYFMAGAELSQDQERLAKLWDAYEIQEKELELSMKKIATMENKLKEMNRVTDVLKKAMEDRDREIRELELKLVSMEEEKSKFEPKMNELTKLYQEEKDRYSKLFTITEELEEELEKAKNESEIKDKWFERNVGMLENLRESIVDRNIKLKTVESGAVKKSSDLEVEAPKKSVDRIKVTKTETDITDSSEQAPTQEKDITFKAVNLESKPESPETNSPSEPTGSTTFQPEDEPTGDPEPKDTETISSLSDPDSSTTTEATKNETIYEFTKISDIDPLIAESLYNSGYTSVDKLKSATTEELANIDGISPTLARKIRTNLFEMGQ
jgi:hypothetical protein